MIEASHAGAPANAPTQVPLLDGVNGEPCVDPPAETDPTQPRSAKPANAKTMAADRILDSPSGTYAPSIVLAWGKW